MDIKSLRLAWEASEKNMRSQFSSSSYKNITFEKWYYETFVENKLKIKK